MKKTFILMCMLAVVQLGMAQVTVDELVDKYAKTENAVVQKVDKEMMESMKDQAPEQLQTLVEMGVDAVDVVVLEEDEEITKEFTEDCMNLLPENYEELVAINHEGTLVRIILLEIDGFVKNMLVLVSSDFNNVIVNLKGNIERQKLEELMNDNSSFKINNMSLDEMLEQQNAE